MSYNLDPQRQLKASYSKRIQRPFVQQLNPFGFREDALTVFEGNPRLQPEYTHSYELGYQQSLPKNLGFSAYGPPSSGQKTSQLPHSLQKSAKFASWCFFSTFSVEVCRTTQPLETDSSVITGSSTAGSS